jgi:hypothetical protein
MIRLRNRNCRALFVRCVCLDRVREVFRPGSFGTEKQTPELAKK